MGSKVYEAVTLQSATTERAQQYERLKEQFLTLRKEFGNIVNNHDFQGHGAEAIKGFYQGQMDVVDAWIRFFDTNVSFFKGIPGDTEDVDLSGDTLVQVPFLDDNVERAGKMAKEMVAEQQDALQNIFNDISDLVSLSVFSKENFNDQMDQAEKKRSETVEKVNELDQRLSQEYAYSQNQEQHIYGLFAQLMEATRRGENISPLYFNAEAYRSSEVYRGISQAEQDTSAYLASKKKQQEEREIAKKIEEMENRPWHERAWDTVCTFTGEVTGYYDTIRASTGVDPVTGRKLSEAERITAGAMAAAGFIPVIGWAGRAAKGGSAIYKTVRAANAADHILDSYKTAQGLSRLQKAEYGIYGLVSANGFGEYFTGKDMFGNELTEEQRNQSLFNAFAIAGVGSAGYALDRMDVGKMLQNKFPYSTQYVKQQADKAMGLFKSIRTNVGNTRIPVNFRVEKLVTAAGHRVRTIVPETKTAKELMQQASITKNSAKEINTHAEHKLSKEFTQRHGFDAQLDTVLKNLGMNRAMFNRLKLTPIDSLTDLELEKMKAIRDSVMPVTRDTLLQKTIPFTDIKKYLDGDYSEIGGYVAKAEDVQHIKSYEDFVETLRLDYVDSKGNRPYPEGGGPYGIIKFKTLKDDSCHIPYGERFGGINKDGPPCTLNGFTGSRNGIVVPEFRFDGYYLPRKGAEIYQVIDGEEILVGVFDSKLERFIPVN